MEHLKDKRILVTGVAGTIGAGLIDQLLGTKEHSPKEVIGVDINESELFFLEHKYSQNKTAQFYMGDIKDRETCFQLTEGIDIVFHVAALKHVILCEKSPMQAVQTNIIGVENLIAAARYNKVQKLIFTSSDKAVNPTNVMGTSKLMGERLITAANSRQKKVDTIMASTRFGNVLGSNGSVIPIFKKQIQNGGPVTLTDERMTRFVMSSKDAVKLVIDSALHARGGEVFITKMPVIRIKDLAKVMISELANTYGWETRDIGIKVIGSKPGEKLYEELMSEEETTRAIELERYFSVLPAFRGVYRDIDYKYDGIVSKKVENPYISFKEKFLSHHEIRDLLLKNELI